MSNSEFFIGVDFGAYTTRCAVLINQDNKLRILDLCEIPIQTQCKNLLERYNIGISDVSEYLKTKKLVVKSVVSNLRGKYIRSVKTSLSKTSRKPVHKIKKSLINASQRKLSVKKGYQDEKVVKNYTGNFKIHEGELTNKSKCDKDVSVDSISIYSKTSDCVDLLKALMDNGVYSEEIMPSNLSYTYLVENIPLDTDEYFIFLDIGHHRTEVSMMNQDVILAVDNFPFGGDDITTMIMEEFKISFNEAEKLKLSWGDQLSDVPFGQNKQEVRFAKRLRNELFYLFQMVKKSSMVAGLNPDKFKQVLFSGGTSQQFGLIDIANEFYNRPCSQIGKGHFKYFLNNHIKPEMSCAIGLSYISYLKRTSSGRNLNLSTTMHNYFSKIVEKVLFTD